MSDWLHTHLRPFLAPRSGTRFRRWRRRRVRRHPVLSVLVVAAGLLLVLAGVAMLVLPGPGLLVIALGAALIAGESATAARLLDRLDFCLSVHYRRWRGARDHAG